MADPRICGSTRIIGIFGDPIAHTRSPAIHNAAFRALNLPYVYTPFHVRSVDLARATSAIRALDLAGVNVTVPHKERIVRYLDSLSPEAELCGAVNTVIHRSGTLHGDNTDGRGFLESLREIDFFARDCQAVVIGAGGSARAVLASLVRAGTGQIAIVNRSLGKARALARTYGALGRAQTSAFPLEVLQDPAFLGRMTLVVNCTTVGLHGEDFIAAALEASPRSCVFYDLLYRAGLTPFLRRARRAGRRVLDGRRMLLHQAALSFTLWTRRPAPLAIMERALARALRTA